MNTLPPDDFHTQPVLVAKGQKLVLADDSIDRKPRFIMMGQNVPKLMQQLNQATSWLFWRLAEERDVLTNICVLTKAQLSDAEYGRLRSGLMVLQQMNICKRVKQNTYMFNPDVLIPRTGYINVRSIYANY